LTLAKLGEFGKIIAVDLPNFNRPNFFASTTVCKNFRRCGYPINNISLVVAAGEKVVMNKYAGSNDGVEGSD